MRQRKGRLEEFRTSGNENRTRVFGQLDIRTPRAKLNSDLRRRHCAVYIDVVFPLPLPEKSWCMWRNSAACFSPPRSRAHALVVMWACITYQHQIIRWLPSKDLQNVENIEQQFQKVLIYMFHGPAQIEYDTWVNCTRICSSSQCFVWLNFETCTRH